jgi:hypothetical protein
VACKEFLQRKSFCSSHAAIEQLSDTTARRFGEICGDSRAHCKRYIIKKYFKSTS